MQAWRISTDPTGGLDGSEGRQGGRWHAPGQPLLYAASSCALAVVEFAVHLDDPPAPGLHAVHFDVPDDLRIDTIAIEQLPPDWREPSHHVCCTQGTRWLATPHEERGALLRVPSAVVPLECNLLIDPAHPDACRVTIRAAHPFTLDARLVK